MRTMLTGAQAGIVFALLCLGGCEFKGGQGGLFGLGGGGMTGAWQPQAETLRLHPSTRFTSDNAGRPMLQARVEFLDAMGDSIKAVGEFRLELFASDDMGRTVGRRLYQWQIDARTLDEQRNYYDSVTRSYLFRLRLDEAQPPNQPTLLRVTFIPAERSDRLESAVALPPA